MTICRSLNSNSEMGIARRSYGAPLLLQHLDHIKRSNAPDKEFSA